MTDPVPAAATGLLAASPSFDRRNFLATLAAAGVMTAGATAPVIAEPTDLASAYAGWLRASKLADAACEATWEVEDLYEEPERPRWHPMRDEGGHKAVKVSEGKYRCYLDDSSENIAHLQQLIAAPEIVFTAEGWTPDMFPPRVEAARRTLALILTWKAEADRRADACGLTAARAIEQPLMEDVRARRDAIFAATPSSFQEAAFQAALLDADWNEDAASRLCATLRRLAGIPAYFEEEISGERSAA